MAVTGHYGNWEYLSTLGLVTEYPVIGDLQAFKKQIF